MMKNAKKTGLKWNERERDRTGLQLKCIKEKFYLTSELVKFNFDTIEVERMNTTLLKE